MIPEAVLHEYWNNFDDNPEDRFLGAYETQADYVQETAGKLGVNVPSWLHIDWEGTFTDLTMDDLVIQHGGRFYIFDMV